MLIELEHSNVLKVMEYIVDAGSEMVYIVTEYAHIYERLHYTTFLHVILLLCTGQIDRRRLIVAPYALVWDVH